MTERSSGGEDGYYQEQKLVDFLAIAVRYRKVLIAVPGIATLAAVLALYLLPFAGIRIIPRTYVIQSSTKVEQFPKDVSDYVDIDTLQSLNKCFSSIAVVKDLYFKYFPSDGASMDDEQKNAYIKQEIIAKKLKFFYDSSMSLYTLSFITNDKDKGRDFLLMLWNVGMTNVHENLTGKYKQAIALLEKQLEMYQQVKKQDVNVDMAVALLVGGLKKIQRLEQDSNFPFDGGNDVVIFESARIARSKIALFVLFGSLAIACLAAFTLNTGRNIKNDPYEMSILKDALRKQK